MNRGRPRHNDILTPREWEVLALISDGLTNEQIAERLGISFGTAKYHVAEIISKLGVERREQAPAAARRARTPAVPFWLAWLRGRFFWPAIGAGLVAAVLLLLSAMVFTGVLSDPSTSAPEGDLSDAAADFQPRDAASQADVLARTPAELSSFYYELVVKSKASQDEPMLENMRIRVWYMAPDKWRVEEINRAAKIDDLRIADGKSFWSYSVENETYYSDDIDPGETDRARAPNVFGPILAENIDAFMTQQVDGSSHYWEVNETELLQGRDALVLVQACCRQGQLKQRTSEQRWWIDPTYNFLLRLEEKSLGTGGVILYEMTEVQYNPDLDDSLFVFEPPPGATEVLPP